MPVMHDRYIMYREETFLVVRFFVCGAITKLGLGHINVDVTRSNKIRHKLTLGWTPRKGRSARRRDHYLHNTQQTQETKIVSR